MKNLTSLLVIVISLMFLLITPVEAKKQGTNTSTYSTLKQTNDLIYNYHGQSKAQLINDKLKNSPDNKQLLELKLDLIYATDLFSFLWDQNDHKNSLSILENLKKANYALPKVYLYESIYYKNLGEWEVASQLVNYSIKKLKAIKNKTPADNYLLARALFEKAIYDADQKLIVDAIELIELMLNDDSENIVYLSLISEMFRYIEVPDDLFETFSERVTLYQTKLDKIQKRLTFKSPDNVLYKKLKNDDCYYNEVMKPITEEILRRWKQAKTAQSCPADLMYFFQVTSDRRIINIRLISGDNASDNLKIISEGAIANSIVPYLPDDYPLETMNILFIFSYQ